MARALRKPDAEARERALQLSRDKGIGCRAIAKALEGEGWRVSKTQVNDWLREAGIGAAPRDPNADDAAERPSTDASTDTGGHVPDVPDASAALARARPPADLDALDSVEARVEHLADLIASGRWLGRPTAKKLAAAWGLHRDTVFKYARTAALLCKTDRGTREELRQVSLGKWERLHGKAVRGCDLKAAASAQAGWDRAAGVVEPGGAKVINIVQLPGVQHLLRAIVGGLDEAVRRQLSAAETRELVIGSVRAAQFGGGAAPPALPARQAPQVIEMRPEASGNG